MHCEWVRSDVDGCEWVRMGALGHRMHGGGMETRQEEAKMNLQGIFQWLWPGKFPRTSCFCEFGKKWCEWVQMGIY